ncbi:L-lysine exporter family protein LysE/ArgO [Peribacillus deserti]|uniref:L-lysine exporter family protein LysE/ArgO n=1 Tax=Peribacillus deserti TaxID=673318 RepID=A0ABS2QM94_9BACI|nr:LysE/ArgO family amino acid transporter [Peribacillus deserti]MBM7693884.1 L-lysine exporter family protein LysE/ArgO [Peribacillus deserti]
MGAVIIHGVILAFGLILPLGVQNIFIFQQGAYHTHFVRALPAVLTAALCDLLLITLAVGGVSMIVLANDMFKTILMAGGCLFLFYMGWVTWKTKNGKGNEEGEAFTGKKQILFAASVSLLNPHAILDTVGVIGTSSLQYSGTDRWLFALSCVTVSWIWFFGLAVSGRYFGKMDQTGKLMSFVNKCSALIIWGVALMLLYSLL